MKGNLTCLIISLTLLASGCKKDEFKLPGELETAKANLTQEFGNLNQNMAEAVVYTISTGLDTSLIRAKLLELVKGSNDITDVAWVTPKGIMQIIEPRVYYGSQGIDISGQSHVAKAFDTKLPVLSNTFMSVEGFYAAVVIHPVVISNAVAGGFSALFFPEQILENVLKPIFEGQDFEMWVMESDGRILYDQDKPEIGLDLFTDPLYAGFPELIEAGKKMQKEESGTTTYSFFKAGTQQTVTKLTYWTTFELYGTEWKLVWVKAK